MALSLEQVASRAQRSDPDPPALVRSRRADDDKAKLEDKIRELEAENRSLADLALTDPLTGLLNHRASHERLDDEIRRAGRQRYPIAVSVVDLDFFKGLNDSWGHEVGDKVLQALAHVLTNCLRPGDIAGRLGGDEFMVALVNSDTETAEEVMERLRVALARVQYDAVHIPLSMSGGIARFPFDGTTAESLVGLADQGLYHAKATGRGRCVVYSPHLAVEETRRVHERNLRTTVEAMARAVDTRNGYTHLHSQAVAYYATRLAESLGLADGRLETLRTAAVLHDVGKIGVPDSILWKMTPLTTADREAIRGHSVLGSQILAGLGVPDIPKWVLHLHERFDGHGYPGELSGEQIPFESRLLAVADALDAMTCPRVYREPLTLDEAGVELEAGAGSQFDPALARALTELVRSGDIVLQTLPDTQPGTRPAPESRVGIDPQPEDLATPA